MKALAPPTKPRADGRLASSAARAFCQRLGLPYPTIYPMEEVARLAGLVVRYVPLSGTQAMLVRHEDEGQILVSEYLNELARRFAIAHELGHDELHRHLSRLPLCMGEAALSSYVGSPFERESDIFARELLMPRKLVLAMFRLNLPTWEIVEAIARAFEVSLTAAALRFIEVSPLAVALVRSRGNVVEWSRASYRFNQKHGRIPNGHVVNWNSAAFDAKSGAWFEPREGWLDAWVPSAEPRIGIEEQSIGIYGGALTLVWLAS